MDSQICSSTWSFSSPDIHHWLVNHSEKSKFKQVQLKWLEILEMSVWINDDLNFGFVVSSYEMALVKEKKLMNIKVVLPVSAKMLMITKWQNMNYPSTEDQMVERKTVAARCSRNVWLTCVWHLHMDPRALDWSFIVSLNSKTVKDSLAKNGILHPNFFYLCNLYLPFAQLTGTYRL